MTDLENIKRNQSTLTCYTSRMSLKRDGKEMVGVCPFHSEKTPSFRVSSHQGGWVWRCFGACAQGGDIISFVQQADQVSFKEALERVKKEIGQSSFSATKAADRIFSSLSEPTKPAISYSLDEYNKFEIALAESKEAKEWLAKRGISYDTARRLHIGYRVSVGQLSPESHLRDSGWIAFPSVEGDRVTSIKYRSITSKSFCKQGGMAKGDNTPLFNSESIEPLEPIYLVEGELDCLTLVAAGYKAVSVQSASTPLTAANKEKLLEADYIILAGDNDPAGNEYMQKAWSEIQERVYRLQWPDPYKDANQVFLEACKGDVKTFHQLVEELTTQAKANPMPNVSSLQEIMLTAGRTNIADHPSRLRFPWKTVDNMAILLPGSVTSVMATSTKQGKELEVSTPVLTPYGSIPIGKIKEGDIVIGANGKPTTVTGVFPQGIKKAYKISFTDGCSVISGEEHLWAVRSTFMARHNRPYRVLSVKQILAMDAKGQKIKTRGYRHHIPTVSAVEFCPSILPIKPYLLGALLGDGGFTGTITITNIDSEILDQVRTELPEGMSLRQCAGNKIQYNLVYKGTGYTNPLNKIAIELGLREKRSEHKFIPDIYKFSSTDDRVRLLQGLLDTDGCVTKSNSITYCSVSKCLIDDVSFVIRSLGGQVYKLQTQYRPDGRAPLYVINLSLPQSILPFTLSRKLARMRPKRCNLQRAIASIEECGSAEMACISVSAPDGLYVIKDFIVTHNTCWTMQASVHAARQGEVVLNYQCELSPEEFSTMVTAHLLRKDRNHLSEPDYKTAARLLSGVRYYIGRDPTLSTVNPVLDLIESGIRRLSATICILDHVHFICRNEANEVQAQANAMQRIKRLAVQYKVKFIVVGQPRKANQQFKGKLVDISDWKGSEAGGSDADAVFAIHRDRIKDRNETTVDDYDPLTEVHLLGCRSRGDGGTFAKLMYFGKFATFNEMSNEEPERAELF